MRVLQYPLPLLHLRMPWHNGIAAVHKSVQMDESGQKKIDAREQRAAKESAAAYEAEQPPADADDRAEKNAYTICGSLCTTSDILARGVQLPTLHIGDKLVFEKTGAYSVTEGLALFLSRELPAVYLQEGDRLTLVRDVMQVFTLNS